MVNAPERLTLEIRATTRRRRPLVAVLAAVVLLVPLVAPATVEEQRARLPPPAHCGDPIAGTWVALRYVARLRIWNHATAIIRRRTPGGGALVGEVVVESWTGDAAQSSPPPCAAGVLHQMIEERIIGTWDELTRRAELHAIAWSYRARPCETWNGYSLDHFTGAVDRELDEFQAVNNDHNTAVNEPTLFRRTSCATQQVVEGSLPPPMPPRERRSCLRW